MNCPAKKSYTHSKKRKYEVLAFIIGKTGCYISFIYK